jgi:hypothetical protein
MAREKVIKVILLSWRLKSRWILIYTKRVRRDTVMAWGTFKIKQHSRAMPSGCIVASNLCFIGQQ